MSRASLSRRDHPDRRDGVLPSLGRDPGRDQNSRDVRGDQGRENIDEAVKQILVRQGHSKPFKVSAHTWASFCVQKVISLASAAREATEFGFITRSPAIDGRRMQLAAVSLGGRRATPFIAQSFTVSQTIHFS